MSNDTDIVRRLFAGEVPEIAAGTIEIKAIARKPGYRSKLALYSQDLKNIVDALGKERIDLIRWHDSPEQLIVNSLQPAIIEKVLLHPAEHRAVVVVKPDQVSLVQGRRGENQQLASELSGWQIDLQEV